MKHRERLPDLLTGAGVSFSPHGVTAPVSVEAVPRKLGRPKALPLGSATTTSQRSFDDLLLDIARLKQKAKSIRDVVIALMWQPKYQACSYRTLRRDVTVAMCWAASRLHRLKLFRDDIERGVPFDEAVDAAQARKPPRLNKDQFSNALQCLREALLAQNI